MAKLLSDPAQAHDRLRRMRADTTAAREQGGGDFSALEEFVNAACRPPRPRPSPKPSPLSKSGGSKRGGGKRGFSFAAWRSSRGLNGNANAADEGGGGDPAAALGGWTCTACAHTPSNCGVAGANPPTFLAAMCTVFPRLGL